MKTIALLYSFNSVKSAKIASKIAENLKGYKIETLNIENCQGEEFLSYDGFILSVPNYWDEILPALEKLELNGKKVALFGLGDQKNYPENFCDAVGILAGFFAERGAKIIGFTSREGYDFESSKALKDNYLSGLLLDQENQSKLTDERIQRWTKQLELEFN